MPARLDNIDSLPPRQTVGLGLMAGIGVGGILLLRDPWAWLSLLGVPVAVALAVTGRLRWVELGVREEETLPDSPLPLEVPPTEAKSPEAPFPWPPQVPTRMPDPVLGAVVALPGGTFWMGSKEGEPYARPDERPRHPVRVSPFCIGETVVTCAQWEVVMGEKRGEEPLHPVNRVTWEDAARFCNKASHREGRGACYKKGLGGWTWDRQADGYRLPTEAEWEYAARAGTEGPWSCSREELSQHGWFDETHEPGGPERDPTETFFLAERDRSHPVATRLRNPWGLYDIHGNVWEWCWDRYRRDAYSQADREVDPVVDAPNSGEQLFPRVVRGGSFGDTAVNLRSAPRLGRLGPSTSPPAYLLLLWRGFTAQFVLLTR